MILDASLRLRHVRTFLEIARAESVSVAAARLNVTQPAVSRSLKDLEEMLGTPLFDRVGRGLRLNEAGRVFQAHASASISELMRGSDRLTKEGGVTTRLSVGVLPTAATELVPQAALAFRRQTPNVRLHVLTGPNWLLFNQLRDGALDLVVGRMPERDAATGVLFQHLFDEDVVIVCRPGHPILDVEDVPGALMDFPLITPPKGAVISEAVARYFNSVGLPDMQGVIETVALPVGRRIVAQSDALWFISQGVVADEIALGRLVEVGLSSRILSGPVGISTARSARPNASVRAFSECLQEAAGIA